jgi:aspartate/methionine/tyrosine aminotransferase
MAEYTTLADEAERSLFAELLSTFVGVPVDAENVFWTIGGTEAISLVATHAARTGTPVLLPLPCYYAFDQACIRSGIASVVYYDDAGRTDPRPEDGSKPVLVQITPNGVTGSLFELPVAAEAPTLCVHDCVFLASSAGGWSSRAALRAATLERDPSQWALVLTAAKDLAIPGIRAGVIVTGNEKLRGAIAAHRFDTTFSLPPFTSAVMCMYLAIVLLDAGEPYSLVRATFRDYGRTGLLPPPQPMAATLKWLRAFRERLAANYQRLFEAADVLRVPEQPTAGYSLLAPIRRRFADAGDFVRWANWLGREHHLKVNPQYLFGGDPTVWDRLYPGTHAVRVNLSVDEDDLTECLRRLRAGVRGRNRESWRRRNGGAS